jgi:ankyrin repeat protein
MNKFILNLVLIATTVTILGSSLNCKAQKNTENSALGLAVKLGEVETVKKLLKSGIDPNKTCDQETPLALSTKLKDDEIFNLIVNAKGVKIDAQSTYIATGNGSKYTCTALISAVREMKIEQVKILLDKGANVDLFDKNAQQDKSISWSLNALMNAIMLNKPKAVEIAKLLVERTKNIDIKATLVKDGVTALILACQFPLYNEVSKMMIKKGAKLELPGTNSPAFTAVGTAIYGGNPEMVKFLIASGAKLNDKTDKAFLHLSYALGIENLETIEILLDAGIDPNVRFSSSKYPVINTCVKCKNPKVLELMIKRGADVNAKDGIGQSVLKYANGGKKVKKNIAILKAAGAKE